MAILPGSPPVGPFSATAPARLLPPQTRQQLALDALGGQSVTELAAEQQVSRKFVYQQLRQAHDALDHAFNPGGDEPDQLLFWLPVTKPWLRQLVLGLTLIGHSSLRGVTELLADVFDYPLSVGTVHNILHQAVAAARSVTARQDLAAVRLGAHDEIFQAGRPVLVGADVASTYCYLLSSEEHRDADTWGVRLLELSERSFRPDATIADFAGDCGPDKPRPCRMSLVAVTSSMPYRRQLPWSVTWRIVPTKPSPHAVVWKTARPAPSTGRAARMRRW